MKKLEPGMLCRVVGGLHDGVILTLVKFVGTPPPIITSKVVYSFQGGDWWETDTLMSYGKSRDLRDDNLISACQVEPINPDHKPADEDFQEIFKRIITPAPVRA